MSYLESKFKSFSRYLIWHYLSKKLELIHVAEFPKSGGTWLKLLLSEYLGLDLYDYQISGLKNVIIHGHDKNNYKNHKTVFIVRDGRDVVISYYFHILREPKIMPEYYIKAKRDSIVVNDKNIIENLPHFIEFINKYYPKKFNRFSWSSMNESYLNDSKKCLVKYEDMLLDTEKELSRVLNYLGVNEIDMKKLTYTVNKLSFKNQTNRNRGQEDKGSFLRKGISGDWKNYFTQESANIFNIYSGDMLIKLGYEKDDNWIKKLN